MKNLLSAMFAVAILATSAAAFAADAVATPEAVKAPAKVVVSKEVKAACHKEAGKDKAKFKACLAEKTK
jgi:ABC-type Zn uptake system ZnuABC Zn-binding protein ZnuA